VSSGSHQHLWLPNDHFTTKALSMPENLTELLRRELAEIDRRVQELTRRKQAIQSLLTTYQRDKTASAPELGNLLAMVTPNANPMSSLDMAEQVIAKHGEMKAEEVMESIRLEFGVKPAHTLPQMLYIRARSKKRFYRTAQGKFGIVSNRKKSKKTNAA
jgi:hypothetical protein